MKSVQFLLFFCFLSNLAFADEVKVPGTVITKEGERIRGSLWVHYFPYDSTLNFYRLQPGVKFVSVNGVRIDLNPKSIAEYRFEWMGQEIRMLSSDCKEKKKFTRKSWKNVFLKLEVDGRMKVLIYYHSVSNLTPSGPPPRHGYYTSAPVQEEVLKRDGEQGVKMTDLRNPETRKAFFADCPDLYERVEDENPHFGECMLIAKYYNANCR